MRLLLLAGLMTLYSCVSKTTSEFDAFSHIQDTEVRDILKRAISWSGGIDRWRSLDSIIYTKDSKLFLSDSGIESESIQRHAYAMRPKFSARITWSPDTSEFHEILYGEQSVKRVNDSVVAEGRKVEETVLSAIYVLGMPFKLLDPGVQLSYEGKLQIGENVADAIRAGYDPNANENHSTTDLWWYYFDEVSGAFLGCLVYHPPTYAYIENQAFHDVEGIKFHAHRKSYRSDSARNIEFLRAEFWYSDYEVSSASE